MAERTVRVCIWPDYYGITYRDPRNQQLGGIDIDLSTELGKDLKARVQYVDSSFPTLIDDLRADRCDVAMFAVGSCPGAWAAPENSRGPTSKSDIYGVTTRSNPVIREWADIDQPGVAVAVQTGTFMEPVMAERLKHAKLVRIAPPATRERELESGRVDVFMTDYPYSRRLLDSADWLGWWSLRARCSSFLMPMRSSRRDAWLQAVDDFVARIKSDGRLQAAAARNGLAGIVVP